MEVQNEHKQMVTALAKDGHAIMASLTSNGTHCWHMATGISGESGELLEAVVIPVDKEHVIEELGDFEFYMEGLRQGCDIDRDDVLNIAVIAHVQSNVINFNYTKEAVRKLAIESSNVLDFVKKIVIYNTKASTDNLIKYLWEIEHSLHAIREHFNVTREEVLEQNIKKLSKGDGAKKPRYQGGVYTDQAAQDRIDKNVAAAEK